MKSQLIGKDPDAGKGWGQEEKRGNRGWDGWIASSTQWTWVWANSRRQWRTGKPGMLQSMGSQRIGHDWATELNWTTQLCCCNETPTIDNVERNACGCAPIKSHSKNRWPIVGSPFLKGHWNHAKLDKKHLGTGKTLTSNHHHETNHRAWSKSNRE